MVEVEVEEVVWRQRRFEDGGGHCVRAVLHRLVVAVEEEEEADLPRRVRLEGLAHRDEVLERLGHLEALDLEVTGVQEVVDLLHSEKRG